MAELKSRDEADEESDVDDLIVLDRVDDYSSEIDRTSELIAELSLELGASLSRVSASKRRWLEDESLLFLNVREEAIAV
ncbi:MAG: hypothetical protein JXR96_26560 [Deltaproteobacteria bacterium]|nr:hypothetical protein [Deltaproteobacteria bacterium]